MEPVRPRRGDLDKAAHPDQAGRNPPAAPVQRGDGVVVQPQGFGAVQIRVPRGHPLSPGIRIRRTWNQIRKTAGLGDMRVHDLRHSHAKLLVNAGFSLPVIGAALGHKTPSTTARYAHLADDTVREAARSVGNVVSLRGAK